MFQLTVVFPNGVLNNFQTFVFSILLSIDSIVVASKVVKWQSYFGLAGYAILLMI
jgi:hypothetical protein